MLVSLSLLALSLTGCPQRFSNDNLAVVEREMKAAEAKGARDPGVSPKELESILGQPKEVRTHRLPLETQKKEVEVVQYYYEQDGQTLEFHFFDNKLISKVPRLPEANSAPKGEATPAATPEKQEAKP